MSKKPRNKYLSKIHTKVDGKYDFKKKSKPWNKREQIEKVDIFANVSMSDILHGHRNKKVSKRDSIHRERMG